MKVRKMNMTKNLQMKLTLLLFTLLIALSFSGAVSAVAVSNQPTGSYVVETQENFYDSTAIQDAIDDADTVNGDNIQIDPSVHFEQVTVTKNITLTGMGTTPERTNIVSSGGTVIIPSGVSAVLENMAIWDINNDPAIINNGQLTLINCLVNGEYYANETMGTIETLDETGTLEQTKMTMETMTTAGAEPTTINDSLTGSIEGTGTSIESTGTSDTETPGTGTTSNSTGTSDPGIPLASLASGMLMVMGGTVISKKHQ
jgi:hypothetical protein